MDDEERRTAAMTERTVVVVGGTSGIGLEVARTLVSLGADLSSVVTCANLQTAITHASKIAGSSG